MNGRASHSNLTLWSLIVAVLIGLVTGAVYIGELKGGLDTVREALAKLDKEEPRMEDPVPPDPEPQERIRKGPVTFANGGGWGNWSDPQFCDPGWYICGLEQRVEPRQGDGDDTAMNAIAFYCCSD